AFCYLPQDSNSFLDVVLSDRLPAEVRRGNLEPAPIPNFIISVKKTFVTNRDFWAEFSSGLVYGLSSVHRRGNCGAPVFEGVNSTLSCHVALDGVRVSYLVRAKGHKILGSTTYNVDGILENTNFFVQVTSARSHPAIMKTISLQSLGLRISESKKLGLNKERQKKYHEAIRSNVQSQLTALLNGSFRDAFNRAISTVTLPFF
ncbi:hypothetical protein V5799_011467, partial [Amblyomma americanum]